MDEVKIMGFPGEELVSTALEKFSDGVMRKMDESEARRNREFSYKLKELEFYKGNYDKEIKSVFDRWFDFLQNSLLSTNRHLTEDQQRGYKKKVNNFLKPDKSLKLKIDTMKYGGTETGKALALFSQISYTVEEDNPKFDTVYGICILLSTLKLEILGQEIAPDTILKVLLTDYGEKSDVINESRVAVENLKADLFPEEQV
ncbi:MAG: hypothetical protein LIO42_02280 [Oscillospiraceae bacterium]|nr:hypothetical protein [Oscillospiraceae bacterium]